MRRRVKGLLNRLSSGNFESILISFENLFQEYSRHDITIILTEEIILLLSTQIALYESFVILYTALIYTLSHFIGGQGDLMAYFITTVVSKFQDIRNDIMENGKEEIDLEEKKKIAMNLDYFIAFMYTFQV